MEQYFAKKNIMSFIKDEAIRASSVLGLGVIELTQSESSFIIDQIVAKYANGKKGSLLWENFVGENVISNDKDAWKQLKDIVGKEETIMFFNPKDEPVAFKLSNGDDVVAVLGESFGFEFYLTNKVADYVICFNHHDYLIACGNVPNQKAR